MPVAQPRITRSVITEKKQFNSKVLFNDISVDVAEDPYNMKYIKNKNSYTSVINQGNRSVKIEEFLPFRVRFYNVGITNSASFQAAPIGIAIIGFNNYIL